jgi:hypothetical protein
LILSINSFAQLEDKSNSNKNQQPRRQIEFEFRFNYRNFPLEIKIYEPNRQVKMIAGKDYMANSFKDIPLQRELTDKKVKVYEGEQKFYLMVVENKTNDPVYFYASPHEWNPEDEVVGSKLYCLCYNRIYTVLPGQFWYRVGSLSVGKGAFGEKLQIIHRIVGIEKSRVKEMLMRMEAD